MILEGVLEESIASSTVVNTLLNCMKVMANETKKITDTVIKLSERIDQHEKILVQLCELQKTKEVATSADYSQKKKNSTKLN